MRPKSDDARRQDINEKNWLWPDRSVKKGYLININPYLFLLLRKMIEFEAIRYCNDKKIPMVKGILREEITSFLGAVVDETFARHIEKNVWNASAFCFLEDDLNRLCQLTISFGEFKSWEEFSDYYGMHVYALIAEDYMHKYFFDLEKPERELIIRMVNISDSLLSGNVFNATYQKHGNILEMEDIKSHFQLLLKTNNPAVIAQTTYALKSFDYVVAKTVEAYRPKSQFKDFNEVMDYWIYVRNTYGPQVCEKVHAKHSREMTQKEEEDYDLQLTMASYELIA
ncbi:MAG TPA: hypothetical protein VL098_08415 [Flavipsychrobacter sp.]|nr:hypothetical protein [Flavipsychrobacter sp.]